MTTDTPRQPHNAGRTMKTIAVVARQGHAELVDALLDAGDYDVVFIESVEHAYSHIKRVAPHVVIVCLDDDDFRCVQVLSMLKLDSATSRIPVITHLSVPHPSTSVDVPEPD